MTTQQATPADMEKLLQLAGAEGGGGKAGTVLNDGTDPANPAPMMVHNTGPIAVTIYNRKTGDPSKQPPYMLWQRMQQKDADGNLIFTMTDPGFRPSQGTIKCLLHPDVRTPEYDRMGFAVCKKANIPTLMDLESHMKYTHPRAFGALARDKEERAQQAAIALQQANLEALQALAGRMPQPAVEKPPLYVKQPK